MNSIILKTRPLGILKFSEQPPRYALKLMYPKLLKHFRIRSFSVGCLLIVNGMQGSPLTVFAKKLHHRCLTGF